MALFLNLIMPPRIMLLLDKRKMEKEKKRRELLLGVDDLNGRQ